MMAALGFMAEGLFSLLKRFWPYIVALIALWFAYNWVYDRGASHQKAIDDVQIAELEGKLATATARVVQLTDDLKKVTVAADAQKKADEETVAALKLEAAKAKAKVVYVERVIEHTREVVTPAADRACIVTAGFVWLHDLAASGDSVQEGSTASSPPGDVDAASGVLLSEVASGVGLNYNLCRADRDKLRQWQEWYARWKVTLESEQD